MGCSVFRIWLVLLGAIAVPGVRYVEGVKIFTPSEVEAVNGTQVKLKCTFTSTAWVSPQTVTVSWNFRPLLPGPEESVLYYHMEPFTPEEGRFKSHVVWSGEIWRKDASITLKDVVPTFSGTYICQVRNRPDVHGRNGEITLKVVEQVPTSKKHLLTLAVLSGTLLLLTILFVVIFEKLRRKRRMDRNIEYKWKEPTVWHTAAAAPKTHSSAYKH